MVYYTLSTTLFSSIQTNKRLQEKQTHLLKILSSHEWVTLGIALFTTQSWAIISVSGKAQLFRPVYIHLLNQLHQV